MINISNVSCLTEICMMHITAGAHMFKVELILTFASKTTDHSDLRI